MTEKKNRMLKAVAMVLLFSLVFTFMPQGTAVSDPIAVASTTGSTDMKGVVGLNYYIDETQADIYFQIGSGNSVSNWTVQAEISGVTYDQTINSTGEHFVSVPLSGFSSGTYSVALTILDSSSNVKWSGVDELVILDAPAAGKRVTQIDQNKRNMLVDGSPFFPIGVYGVNDLENKDGITNLQLIKNVGFNVTMRWRKNTTRPHYDRGDTVVNNTAVVHDYLDAVEAAGLYAFEVPVKLAEDALYEHYDASQEDWLEIWPQINEEVLPGVVELAKNHPAVIGYNTYDEPDNRYPNDPSNPQHKLMQDGAEDFYSRVKTADPYHPVLALFAVGLSKNQDWEAWDLPARNYYPAETAHMSQVYRSVKQSSDIAEEMNQPYIVTPLFEDSAGRGKPLSGEEQIAQSYLSLIGGAKGLMYWEWPAVSEDNWLAIQQVVSEVNGLKNVLLERDPEQYYEYEHYGTENSVRTLIKNYAGDTYMIVANAENADSTVTYTLPSRYGAAYDIHEESSVAFSNGQFTETLAPYERRVYRFDNEEWIEGETIHFDISVGATQGIPNQILNDSPAKNYVKNGGFANGYGTVPGWPMGWSPGEFMFDSGENGSVDGRWSIDTNEYFSGGQSMRIHKHLPGLAPSDGIYRDGHTPYLNQSVPVPSSGNYTVSFQAKPSVEDPTVWVFINGSLKYNGKMCNGSTCDWDKVVFDDISASSSVSIKILLRGEGKLWVDDVQVESGTTATSFVDEGTIADTAAPNAPGEPDVEEVMDTEIHISWVPPYDNSGVIKEYQVYNDGVLVDTTHLLMYKLTGLSPDTRYKDIRIKAKDLEGNISGFSTEAGYHPDENYTGVKTLPSSGDPLILFADDFESGAGNWTDVVKTWQIETVNGSQVYAQPTHDPYMGQSVTIAGDSLWTDYAVSAEVNKVHYHYAGILGRYQSLNDYYELYIATNEGTEDGIWYLKLNDNGTRSTLSSGDFIGDGFNYTLELIFDGDQISASIDDTVVTTVTDTTIGSGQIGLRTNPSQAYYDNVEVIEVQ